MAGQPGGPTLGAPPVDPADVPEEELVRLGVGALTDLLLAAHGEGTVPGPTSLRRRPLTRTPTFALTGAPVTSSAVRRALGAAGHAEGGRSPRVLLVAAPLDESLAQVWSARVQRGAPVRWPGFVQRWSGRRHLPPAADLPAVARQWAIRVGPGSVHVIVSAGDPGTVARTAAGILGVGLSPARRGDARALVPRWRDLSPRRSTCCAGSTRCSGSGRPPPARGRAPGAGPHAGRRADRDPGRPDGVADGARAVPGLGG